MSLMAADNLSEVFNTYGTINRHKYIEILEDNLWSEIARHFPEQDCLFQDDNAPIHQTESLLWAGGQTQFLDSASSFFRQI
jgi:hypothetical protein